MICADDSIERAQNPHSNEGQRTKKRLILEEGMLNVFAGLKDGYQENIKSGISSQAVFRESNVAGNDIMSPLNTSGVNVCIG